MPIRRELIASAILILSLLAACGPQQASVQPPRPTNTPVPTFTSTPTVPEATRQAGTQSQAQPTKINAAPTHTPTPQTVLVVYAAIGNVRSGPGTNFGIISSVKNGDILEGPTQEKSGWYEFCCVNDGKPGWISGSLVTVQNKADLSAWDNARSQSKSISGEDLMRNIDEMVGSLVYYRGRVIQSLPDGILVTIEDDDYGNPVWVLYDHAPLRILEGDRVDFIGEVIGPYTYTTSGRGSLTVPLLENVEVRLLE